MNCVYLLVSVPRTYIGATCDPDRRLRQHNGALAGGARATAGRSWTRVLYISGFPTWSDALKFEWKWKRCGSGVVRRITGLAELLLSGKSTSSSTPFASYNSPLRIHLAAGCADYDISALRAICTSEGDTNVLVFVPAPPAEPLG